MERCLHACLVFALAALACGDASPGESEPGRAPALPGAPMEGPDTGVVVGPSMPDDAMAAVILVLTGFDDEGILQDELEGVEGPGSYAVDDVVWTDALAVVRLLAPDTSVAAAGDRLVLGGDTTDVPARTHGGAVYAPVGPLALRFGALFYPHEPPDPGVRQRSGSIWPRDKLCEFRQRADPRAPVFLRATSEGLFESCER